MVLPFDLGKLRLEARNIQKASSKEISMNIYYDKTANEDLIALVNGLLTSDSQNANISSFFLDNVESLMQATYPDIAVVVCGSNPGVVSIHSLCKSKKIPCCFITLTPHEVISFAATNGHKVLKKDIIFPAYRSYTKIYTEDGEEAIDETDFNMKMQHDIIVKTRNWFIHVLADKKMAFASKIEFLREKVSEKYIYTTAVQNAGVGLVPFFHGTDLPLMTLNQAKMILQIAATYGKEIDLKRIPELIAITGSAFFFKWLSSQTKKSINIKAINFVINGLFGFFGTVVVGYAAVAYFKNNLGLEGFVKNLGNIYKGIFNTVVKKISGIAK